MFETGSRSCRLTGKNYLDFTKILPLAAGVWAFPTNSTSAMIVTHTGSWRSGSGIPHCSGLPGTDTTAKSEQQTRLGRALWRELAKDYCRNGDESLSYDNAGTELVDGCQGYECSAKSCQKSRQDPHRCTTYIDFRDSHASGCSPTALSEHQIWSL